MIDFGGSGGTYMCWCGLFFIQGDPIRVRHSGKVYKLGTVCVLDRAPRANFSVRDKQVGSG